ncbi:MAG TPA: rhamnulokinase family protein [Gemmatales bacterium]|nr:rhamnulokinase family protein [Gemmatales bacterium]
MSLSTNLLAIDLGAESGRGILGSFDGTRMTLEVLHRFPNGPVKVADRLHWDVLRLFGDMKSALAQAIQRGPLAGVGVDTWGVDFAFLGAHDELLGNPRHYRDPHTEHTMEEAFASFAPLSPLERGAGGERIFSLTGIQFMRFNSLFQLIALQKARSAPLTAAKKLLFMPDLFHAWLSGVTVNEASITSTSQCYNPLTKDWAWPLLDHFHLPRHLFGKIVPAGTKLGLLLPHLKNEIGSTTDIPVITPTSHDTAAAVAAVPAMGEDWCYISSGTWSLMGVELPAPVINEEVRAANFTNEGGVRGTTRFLKNIMGLWLVQECKRSFARQGSYLNYDQLVQLAGAVAPFKSIINPDDARFLLPDDMPQAIAQFCTETKQPVPSNPGEYIRCCLESLALRYRWTKEKLTKLTGRPIHIIHIVGGGCQNRLLNQLTADATNCIVVAGPTEATALGNLLTQAMGLGLVGSLQQLRDIVRCSFPVERFEPKQPGLWKEPYQRFLGL